MISITHGPGIGEIYIRYVELWFKYGRALLGLSHPDTGQTASL